MLTTSSPTLSAPSSPSASFHSHARSYHVSRRTSSSSAAHSPRFQPQVSGTTSSLRLGAAIPTTSAAPDHSPAVTFARSPQLRKREGIDASTQYTPPDYPPTYHPAPSAAAKSTKNTARDPHLSPQASHPRAKRRETSADAATTEPPEPELRVDPQPAASTSDVSRPVQNSVVGEIQKARQQKGNGNTTAVGEPSSSKRARPQDPGVKVMPLKYEICDVKDLGVLISDMLMELVRLNDDIPLQDGQLTRFHSRAPPGISVRDYLFRLIVHATLSPPILLSMVYYVDRLCALYPAFTISSLTVHRFLITAATVAAKGLSDSFWTNNLYARVGGVTPEVLVDYYKGLVERGEGYVLEQEPDSSPQAAVNNNVSMADASAPASAVETDNMVSSGSAQDGAPA
ncbi:cyclin-domain-containing protein [Lepidopterella palustris CBS 459.81]|uniref:Cyclin-domain-containing protein n=1 Tax=Lepidopterella palustris CBS 459.81 TaxID=1314670 RepID=A0A8E2E900_9PEZI|nr:cyclin-domain-containing protein [Lepidopterella palustris CBS 459.81]